MLRTLSVGVLTPLLAVALTACGSSASDPGSSVDGKLEKPASSSFPATPDLAGSITTSGDGLVLTATWYVGQPVSGSPSGGLPAQIPESALESCNADTAQSVASSVFIPARLQVSYQQGRLATQIALNRTASSASGAFVVYKVNGQWDCGAPGVASALLNAGQTRSFDALMIAPVLSNQHPVFTAADKLRLAFGMTVVAGDQGAPPLPQVSGPGAICARSDPQSQFLFAFRRSPHNLDCDTVFQQ